MPAPDQTITTIVMGVGDLNGILRGKRIPATHWPIIAEEGMALSNAMFALDMTCDIWDTPYANMGTGYPDIKIFPQTDALHPMPWDPGAAFVMGRAEKEDGGALEIDPRNALVKVASQAEELGFRVMIGAELEFFLLDPETLRPRQEGIQVYGLERAMELEAVLGPIRNELIVAGIPIEQSNPEYAPGQVEVNIRFAEAIETADRVVAFRGMVKQLAITHGYVATFMAKPFFDLSGNGFHVHHSIVADGRSLFADGGHLSATGMQYLGGLRRHMAELSVFAAPTPNSYRRRQPNSFCPINTAWGFDNRTVGLRVIEGHEKAVRIEQRDASADANPYLLLAGQIAAGLKGIEEEIDPGPPEMGDAYLNQDVEPIPTDLVAAIALARGSKLIASTYDSDLIEIYLQQAQREVEFVSSQVTPVEQARYLRNF
ncbi:MAG: glutamine synthetase family protein [Acidimicrobiia bacterium]